MPTYKPVGIDEDGNFPPRAQAALGYAPPPSGDISGVTDLVALQALLDQGGTIRLRPGTYYIYPDVADGGALLLREPGTRLILGPDTVIQGATTSLGRYSVVQIVAEDCAVEGGTIRGDLDTHVGSTGEWGNCIDILETAHRFRVANTVLTKAWGDGICIADTAAAYTTGARPADGVLVEVVCDDNRRQGVSVISALRLRVNGGVFSRTGRTEFTAPGAGFAVEPNPDGLQAVTDLVVTGAVFSDNAGRGFYAHATATDNEVTVSLVGCRSVGNDADGYSFDAGSAVHLVGCRALDNGADGYLVNSGATGSVEFNGCAAAGNGRFGFVSAGLRTEFAGCRAEGNWGSGFALFGVSPVLTGCVAVGNNTVDNYYAQFGLEGATGARLVACVSDAGTSSPSKGFEVRAGTTGTVLTGCSAIGTFGGGAFVDGGTGTEAFPKPGAAKPVGVAVTASAIHAALVGLGIIAA